MGFFSDLKEDLSQAVNEIVPEEEAKDTKPAGEVIEIEKEEADKKLDLNELLDSITGSDEPAALQPKSQSKPFVSSQTEDKKNKATDETAVITEGMSVVGDIASTGSLEVLGEVKGNISVNGKLNIVGAVEGDSKAAEIYAESARISGEVNSQGSVKIGQSTVIIGNIFATSAVIAGAVKGDIDVKGPVILDTSAIVMGNIKSKSVQINNGAVIEGVCSQCYADVSPTTFFDKFK